MGPRVSLDDFNDVPSLGDVDEHGDLVSFATLDDFIATKEELSEPLLGTEQETLLPMSGMLLMYGDGGAGKTTLSIDAMAHLASGTSWLGHDVPRPLKMTLIENEGPRAKFRQSLDEKTKAWNGNAPFRQNVTVLEDPWTRFSLGNDTHRTALAVHISRSETDVLVMGPLVTLGMVGGGTPDEVSAFELLIVETRKLTSRPFALWIVHHENKAGDVSGAWERVPDTLVHVQAQGNGHTRLVWRKARWSSENHGKSLDLVWGEGRSFQIREDEEIDHHGELLEKLGSKWLTYKEAAKLIGRKEKPTHDALSDLVRRQEVEYQKGPSGRHANAQCYRLSSAPNALAHIGAHSPLEGLEKASAPLRPPYRETVGSSEDDEDPTTTSSAPGAHLGAVPDIDPDDIPF